MDLPPPRVLAPVADPARRVDFHFTVKYVECDLADKRIESNPVLQLYLSSHFVRDAETGGVVNIPLLEDDRAHCFVGSLIGTLKREYDEIAPSAAIGLCSYAIHRNDNGHACYVNVGNSYVGVHDVLREVGVGGAVGIGAKSSSSSSSYDHTHDLMVKTSVSCGLEPIKKGVVELCIKRVELGPGIRAGAFKSVSSPALQAQLEAQISSYVQTSMDVEMALPDTLQGIERVRVPMEVSELAAERGTGNMFLPIAAFAMMETPRANVGFFQNALERVVARRPGMSTQTLQALWHDFDDKEKCRALGNMIMYGIQTWEYQGDAVETGNRRDPSVVQRHIGKEEMANINTCLSGDCEDGGCGGYSQLKAFLSLSIDPQKNPQLAEIQAIARDDYVPILKLAIVHGAQVKDGEKINANDGYAHEAFGAHMYLSLEPMHQFVSACQKTSAGREFLKLMAPATPPTRIGALGGSKMDSSTHHSRPYLICEGTGHIDSLGYKDPIFEQRKYIAMNFPELGAFKKEIPHDTGFIDRPSKHIGAAHPSKDPPPGSSGFYYADVFGASDYFREKYGISCGGFVHGQVSGFPQGAEMSRGVLFTDLLAGGNGKEAIIPQPRIPAPIMTIIKDAITLRPPARPLELDKSKPLAGPARDPHWDRFVGAVKGFKRTGSCPHTVDLFVRPHQYTADTINVLIGRAAQCEKLFDASYEVEHWTNNVYFYRVRLSVK
jgi:hypothetical protein